MNELATTSGADIAAALPEGYQQDLSLAVQLTRAEVDQQIATARAFPRKLTQVVSNILTLATMDEQTADDCIYALPRAGKAIEGPSIRLAEIIFSQWGNARSAARVVHVDRFEKFVEAEGIFHDLETNSATTMRVRRRLTNKEGKLLSEDMIIVTGNAACSIAKRNAIIAGVPKGVWRKAYEAAEQVLRGDIKTLGARRDAAFKAFAALGVAPEQLFAALEIAGVDDVGLDHLVTLSGMRSAIRNGEATIEEMFPRKAAVTQGAASLAEKLDKVAGVKDSEQVDAKTGEVTDKAPAATKSEKEPDPSTAPKAEPKPRGRPPKSAEKAQDAQGQTEATQTQAKAENPASGDGAQEAGASENGPPFDPDATANAGETGEGDGDDGEEEDNSLFGKGRAAASEGFATFKRWKNRLTTPQFNEVGMKNLDELEKMAKAVGP